MASLHPLVLELASSGGADVQALAARLGIIAEGTAGPQLLQGIAPLGKAGGRRESATCRLTAGSTW